jgi:geranylgeranyl diphosphate synthase type I
VAAPVKAKNRTPPSPTVLARYTKTLAKGLQESLETGNPEILRMLRYHMGWDNTESPMSDRAPGKSIRPTLCLFACEAVGGETRNALPAALALELVHNFSLIHDDIQDGDRERRHRPTVWAKWGIPSALLAGNALRGLADSVLQGLLLKGIVAEVATYAQTILTQRYLEMIEGQYLDLTYENRLDVKTEEYLRMISKKTGALFEASMHLGTMLGTSNSRQIEGLRRCGRFLGLAFQARDDILGIWGNPEITGKPVGADILRRKKSLPIVYAFDKANPVTREKLATIYKNSEIEPHLVNEVLGILEELGAREFSQNVSNEQAEEGLLAIQGQVPLWAEEQLRVLANYFAQRES